MLRRTIIALALLLSFPAGVLAGNPHEVHDTTISISGATLTASGKEAGLGDESQVHIVLTADAACINGGGNHPRAVNKGSFSAAGDFPVQNGQTTFTLSVTASFQPPCAPPMTVAWSNVTVVDTTNGITLYP
jgi:hypothetical protein